MSEFICLPVWLVVSGSLDACLHNCLQSGWWCRAFRVSIFTRLPSFHVSPSLAGGVRLFGCLSSLLSFHVFPVWRVVSGSLDVCLQLSSFTCVPVWLVVSSSLGVCLQLAPFICLPVCLVVSCSPGVCLHLSHFTCLPGCSLYMAPFICFHGRDVALHLSPFICLPACTCFPPFVYQSGWWCLALHVCHHLSFRMSFFTCLPAYVSQRVSGSPRISFFLSLFLSVCLSAAEMLHFPTSYLMIDGCDMMMEMLTMTIGRKSEVC